MFATHLKCKSWDFSRYRYNVIFPSRWCRRWLSRCSVVPWIVVGLAYVGLILCADIKKGVVTRLHGDVCLAAELMCRLPRLAARLSPPSPPDLRYLLGTGQRPFPPPSPAVRSGPSLPPGRQGRSCQGGVVTAEFWPASRRLLARCLPSRASSGRWVPSRPEHPGSKHHWQWQPVYFKRFRMNIPLSVSLSKLPVWFSHSPLSQPPRSLRDVLGSVTPSPV